MRFQVAFELHGLAFVFEGRIEFEPPWDEFGGIMTNTLVMRQEPFLKVTGEAHGCLFRVTFASENVNVKHARAPFRRLNYAGHASPWPMSKFDVEGRNVLSVACHA
jgi:hypothetical protein